MESEYLKNKGNENKAVERETNTNLGIQSFY